MEINRRELLNKGGAILALILCKSNLHALGGIGKLFPNFINRTKKEENFDFNWKFYRGDVVGGELLNFNDNNWRELDLPHDWSIEDLPGTNSPFDPNAIGGVSTGFTVGGTGWYRKEFNIPLNHKCQRPSKFPR
jgi:hypothetical protein